MIVKDWQMAEFEEKVISSRVGFLGSLVKLYIDTVQLPDGGTGEREVIRHPGAVAMVALTDTQDVLLVRQFRSAAQLQMLEIPAGTLEPDEEPAAAAARELQEEIGYKPGKLERLGGEFTAPGYTSEFIHIFLATGLEAAPLPSDADEFIEVITMPFDDALKKVETGELQDGKTIIGLLMAARKLGK